MALSTLKGTTFILGHVDLANNVPCCQSVSSGSQLAALQLKLNSMVLSSVDAINFHFAVRWAVQLCITGTIPLPKVVCMLLAALSESLLAIAVLL